MFPGIEGHLPFAQIRFELAGRVIALEFGKGRIDFRRGDHHPELFGSGEGEFTIDGLGEKGALQFVPFGRTALHLFGENLLEVAAKILQGDNAIVDFDENIGGGGCFLRAGGNRTEKEK
jgi:hypothetical protein